MNVYTKFTFYEATFEVYRRLILYSSEIVVANEPRIQYVHY